MYKTSVIAVPALLCTQIWFYTCKPDLIKNVNNKSRKKLVEHNEHDVLLKLMPGEQIWQ